MVSHTTPLYVRKITILPGQLQGQCESDTMYYVCIWTHDLLFFTLFPSLYWFYMVRFNICAHAPQKKRLILPILSGQLHVQGQCESDTRYDVCRQSINNMTCYSSLPRPSCRFHRVKFKNCVHVPRKKRFILLSPFTPARRAMRIRYEVWCL